MVLNIVFLSSVCFEEYSNILCALPRMCLVHYYLSRLVSENYHTFPTASHLGCVSGVLDPSAFLSEKVVSPHWSQQHVQVQASSPWKHQSSWCHSLTTVIFGGPLMEKNLCSAFLQPVLFDSMSSTWTTLVDIQVNSTAHL